MYKSPELLRYKWQVKERERGRGREGEREGKGEGEGDEGRKGGIPFRVSKG